MARIRRALCRLFAAFLICLGLFQPEALSAEPASSGENTMIITIGSTALEVRLYSNRTAESLRKSLPQDLRMSSWGNEYYGELSVRIDYAGDKLQDVFEPGEVALWPAGNALCIFFGPTPVSRGNEPRMASDGVALGKITGDISVLKKLKGSLSHVRVTAKP